MKYKKLYPKVGDILEINEYMSLHYDKIADDLKPIWKEIPATTGNLKADDGSYVSVTNEIWFIKKENFWNIMNSTERLEAGRQDYAIRFNTPLTPES